MCIPYRVHVPPVRVEARAHGVGDDAREVVAQAAARHVRHGLHAPAAQRRQHAAHVDARGLD